MLGRRKRKQSGEKCAVREGVYGELQEKEVLGGGASHAPLAECWVTQAL